MTLRLTMSPLVPIMPAMIQGMLNTTVFCEHFVLYFLLHSFSTNTQTYRLMISNMTKSVPFNPFGWETLIACIPLMAHILTPVDSNICYELIATKITLLLLIALFYGHIILLSLQWLEREGGKRKWWTIPEPSKTNG